MDVFGMGASLMARSYFSCPIFSGNKNCLQGQKKINFGWIIFQ